MEKLKKVEYMLDHIGDCYEGIISGVTNYGIYVELSNTVEGMIRLSDIPDDFYVYNEIMMEVTGKTGGKTYRMGDRVNIRVVAADKDLRTIDFMFAPEEETVERPDPADKGRKNGSKRRKKAHSK